jgi:hypothetical protein
MTGRDPTRGSAGFSTMSFTIEEITNGLAYGTDNFGRPISVPVSTQRAKGFKPGVGEKWIISKDLGNWTLAAILNDPFDAAQLVEINCPGGLFNFFEGGVGAVKLYVLSTESELSGPGVFTGSFTSILGNIGDTTNIWGQGTFTLDSDNNISVQTWTGTMVIDTQELTLAVWAQSATSYDGTVITIAYPGFLNGQIVGGPINSPFPGFEYFTDTVGLAYFAVQDIQANTPQSGGDYMPAYYRGVTSGIPTITDPDDGLLPGQFWIDITADACGVWVVDSTGTPQFMAANQRYASLTGPGETSTPGSLTQAGGFIVNDDAGDGIYLNIGPSGSSGIDLINTVAAGTGININNTTSGGLHITDNSSTGLFIEEDSDDGGISIGDGGGGITIEEYGGGGILLQDGAGGGITLHETNLGGITLHDDGAGGVKIEETSTGGVLISDAGSGGVNITETSTGPINISGSATPVTLGAASDLLGFYATTPVAQQSGGSIATVADIVTALQALGLLGP